MITYGDLNLKEIRIKADLDFAHFTYRKGMCTCCNSPTDLATRYWRDAETKQKAIDTEEEISYFLFKNADNGSGTVTKNDTIHDYTCIEWAMTPEQMDIVIEELQNQLGDEFLVNRPNNSFRCIEIFNKVACTDELSAEIGA